MKTANTMA